VRWREHPSRKHGVGFDRYFVLTYKLEGKTVSEAVGWASKGWTERKAAAILSELQENHRRGEGPRTLKEKRALAENARQEREAEQIQAEKDSMTFGRFFTEQYLPSAERSKKPGSVKAEAGYIRKWVLPVVGDMPIKMVAPIHVERIKKDILDASRTPRTFEYVRAIIRQVWNMARRDGYVDGDSPTRHVKVPRRDNRRMRFFSPEEAEVLLEALKEKSLQLWRISTLSLYAGLRFGEIAALRWGDVDLDGGILTLRNTKNSRTRTAFLSDKARAAFEGMERGERDDLVFPSETGGRMGQVSATFMRTVNELGFNDGVTEPTQKIVFHSLRHSFASWLVIDGVSLPVIKELLGHRSIAMTERYSHLTSGALQAAVRRLDQASSKRRASGATKVNS